MAIFKMCFLVSTHGAHTHPHKSDFKKPGACLPVANVHLV